MTDFSHAGGGQVPGPGRHAPDEEVEVVLQRGDVYRLIEMCCLGRSRQDVRIHDALRRAIANGDGTVRIPG